MTKPPKRGRPPTERGPYNPNRVRQIGRVSDEDWATLKAAAQRAGLNFTQWAIGILKQAAKDQK